MPLMDIGNPAVIIFLKENYDKENRLRLNWINKHRQAVEHAATLNREPTGYYETDVMAHNMKGGMATITRDHVVAGYNRRKTPIRDGTSIPGIAKLREGHSITKVKLGDPKEDPRLMRPPTDLSWDPIMRPINPELKEVIYKPKPDFGRVEYLKRRTKTRPESKYYFSECSNWDYGWRMGDSALRQRPMYGRSFHLTRTLRTRVGPQPDPSYYKSSDLPGPSKCLPI
ncbi:unnamed protein product [Diatraea saccharalis]|uniref:Sperm microtubule inner protein 1 C-terminal domain-containing protein n=1 Tax=Diatraea saccharalis TaxID=40085 RepID=A0A9N9R359_9NEOP|nr:unnamed protein product [Diatraea saccharalis]